jgi:hypothetical protein
VEGEFAEEVDLIFEDFLVNVTPAYERSYFIFLYLRSFVSRPACCATAFKNDLANGLSGGSEGLQGKRESQSGG